MPSPIRRYRIPDSRLPFINTEIAQTVFQGQPHLVSSTVGGDADGGRLYFWNPESGSHDFRPLGKGAPAAYMLRPDPQGRLYLGCSNGDLRRYDPVSDRIEILVTGELKGITWNGCLTSRFAVWAASPGHVGVYDWREGRLVKVFRPIDTERPEALYGHRVMETPDGKVLLAIDVPQARLIVLDPASMAAQSYTPAVLSGTTSSQDTVFLDKETVALGIGNELHLLQYPGFRSVGRIAMPGGQGYTRIHVAAGRLYACGRPDGSLYALDRAAMRWDLLAAAWTGEEAILGGWMDRMVSAVTVTGVAHRFDPASGARSALDLEAIGPMSAHALCPAPAVGLILGAPFINQRFWTIEVSTGQGRDLGRAAPGGGQINQIVWDPITSRALMSSYTTSSVTAYDPAKPAVWPDNPRVLASAQEHEQMRPMGLAHDGRHVWLATSPEYGHLGGALSRIDPRTGEIRVWRNLGVDQKVNALVVDAPRRRLYFSTDITADCDSAPPTQTTGELVCFDMDSLAIRARTAIRSDLPLVRVLALLVTGEVLAQGADELFAWDAEAMRLRPLGRVPEGLREVAHDGRGGLWTSAGGRIGRLRLADDRMFFEPCVEEEGRLLRIVGDHLFFATGYEVCATAIDV